MAVKRRAPPRLFRQRKGLAPKHDDRVHRAQGPLLNAHHSFGDTTFLPVLDLSCPTQGFGRRRDTPGREISSACRNSDQVTLGDKEFEKRRTKQSRDELRGGLFECSTSNTLSHDKQTDQVLFSPNGLSDPTPNPQQIIQAMARSRIATHSTPTTPRMSPWKHSSCNNVYDAIDEPLRSSGRYDTPTITQLQPGFQADFSIPPIRSAQSKFQCRPNASGKPSYSPGFDLTYPQDPHYIIEPDMGTIQPLTVPLYGEKPLPPPSHWSEQGQSCVSRPLE